MRNAANPIATERPKIMPGNRLLPPLVGTVVGLPEVVAVALAAPVAVAVATAATVLSRLGVAVKAIMSVAKETLVKGRLETEDAPEKATRSEAGAAGFREDLSKFPGLKTLG